MAGTVVLTSQRTEGVVRTAVITATADSSDGSFPDTTLKALGVFIDGTLLVAQTNPGSTAPDDNYDITLIDGDGIDRFGGKLLNRDSATSERAVIPGSPFVSISDDLTLSIDNNTVNSAVIVLTIYYTPQVVSAQPFDFDPDGALAVADHDVAALLTSILAATNGASDSATSSVASSATSVTLKAANAARRELVVFNDSSAILYVKYGATASSTDFTHRLEPYDTLIENVYTGIVDGIWASATGNARVTEVDV